MSEKIHFLIIAPDLDKSAPGIVYKSLLNSLCKIADCTVISNNNVSNIDLDTSIDIIECPPYVPGPWPRIKSWWRKYGMNLKDEYWARKSFYKIILDIIRRRFDCVLTFTSMNYFATIGLGSRIARFFHKKWLIYSVDGIPSPIEWLGDCEVHGIISSSLDRKCRRANMFFSSNPYMLTYQKGILNRFHGKWSYLYTPFRKESLEIKPVRHNGFVFLYLGRLYGLRRVDGLIGGFRKFLSENPDSKLVFVGTCSAQYFPDAEDLIEKSCIELYPFQENLSGFYERADVLLDIAADIPNDIFLSSKIISYLSVGLPIISISGDNSPVRNIMVGDTSIFHAHNNEVEIYESMKHSTRFRGSINRDCLFELFNPDNIALKLVSAAAEVVSV